MWFFKGIVNFLTGGGLGKILDTIDNKMDNDTKKDEIKAEVTKTWINAQANLLVGRTWWFQLFFVIPLGFWWSAVVLDSIFSFTWNVQKLPDPLNDWAAMMLGAVFMIDGGKAILGRAASLFKKGD